jgi:hypothetical protein
MIWLSLSVYAEAQDTPPTADSKQIPNLVIQIQEKQVGTDFSEAEERKAWVIFLRKLTAEEKKTSFDWQSLAATVTGGVITALVTIFALWFNAKREAARERSRMNHEAVLNQQKTDAESQRQRESARLVASTTYADKLLDLRLKQLELFVAPLHALLEQSKGVYAKLQTQLLEDKAKYREVPDPQFGEKQMKLEVLYGKDWLDWRLLDQLPPLKGNTPYAPLIAEIIRIGEEMTALIAKYGAFSLDESGVSDVYGEYLAHFAILRSIYKDPRTEPYPPGQHKIGYYPLRLNGIVAARYLKLQHELQPYLEATSTLLEELKRRCV